jgi:hypothetical protein
MGILGVIIVIKIQSIAILVFSIYGTTVVLKMVIICRG